MRRLPSTRGFPIRAARVTAGRWIVLGLALLAFLPSCSGPPSGEPLDRDEVTAQLPRLRIEAKHDPEDARTQAALGLALHTLGRDGEAVSALERSLEEDPSQAVVALILGEMHRGSGRLLEAKAVYDHADPAPGDGEGRRFLRSARDRIDAELMAARLDSLAAASRADPTSAAGSDGRPDLGVAGGRAAGSASVAVGEFGREGDELFPLGKAISVAVWTTLSRLERVPVADRRSLSVLSDRLRRLDAESGKKQMPPLEPATRIRGVQQRLRLVAPGTWASPYYGGAVDGILGPATAEAIRSFQRDSGLRADGVVGRRTRLALDQALGRRYWSVPPAARGRIAYDAARLLGARYLLDGEVQAGDEGRLRVESELIDLADGAVVASWSAEHAPEEFGLLPGELVDWLLDTEGGDAATSVASLSPETDPGMLAKQPGPNPPGLLPQQLEAIRRFGEATELEDRGRLEDAMGMYSLALGLAPDFELAAERIDALAIASADYDRFVARATREAIGL
jgi:tetratricopeptide (TPR) repeat protein